MVVVLAHVFTQVTTADRKHASLLQAASWSPNLTIGLPSGHQAQLLGGHMSDPEALMVMCQCSNCRRQLRPANSVHSLTQLPHHLNLGSLEMASVRVVQGGRTMPLTAWLAAAAQLMGGDALVGNTVFVFWYGEH
jgi:hypothetical protein